MLVSLTSPSVGFLLNLFAAIGAAAFGVLGIGAKTRDHNGHLTRNGWIALIGLLVAALFAIGKSIYDFKTGEDTALAEKKRNERLMLSVQRNLYPMRGLKATVNVSLDGDDSIAQYKKELRKRIAEDPFCKHEHSGFDCSPLPPPKPQHPQYAIGSGSGLFPDPKSAMGLLLNDLYFGVWIGKRPDPVRISVDKKGLGTFEVDLRDVPQKNTLFVYDYDKDILTLQAFDIPVKDEWVAKAGAYSLVDFFPGFFGTSGGVGGDLCSKRKLDAEACSEVTGSLERGFRPQTFSLTFPYSKSINLDSRNASTCQINHEWYLVFLTPDDVDEIDEFGRVKAVKNSPSEQACTAFGQKMAEHE